MGEPHTPTRTTDEQERTNVAERDDEAFENLTGTMATPSSDYKIRGREAAPSGTAILGHNTAGSGAAHGIEAFVDSGESDAAGVYAEATQTSGSTYGIEAVTQSEDDSSAAVVANAPNGGRGVVASSVGNVGIEVTTTEDTALHSETDGQGRTGVHGHNTASNGQSYGVKGDTDSTDGRAFGVRGAARATDGSGKGVGGMTAAPGPEAAGVYGETAKNNQGVIGEAYDDQSTLPALTTSESAGVFGRTDKAVGYGVVGWSTNNSGILARTDDVNSYGLFGLNTATDGFALNSSGNARVEGYTEITQKGASYYHSAQQTIPSGLNSVLDFDTEVADDRGEFQNVSTQHKFVLDKGGTYRVESAAKWLNPTSGTTLSHEIWVNDGSYERRAADLTTVGIGGATSTSVSKVLHDLGAGDTVKIEVNHDEGSDLTLDSGKEWTYATFTRIG